MGFSAGPCLTGACDASFATTVREDLPVPPHPVPSKEREIAMRTRRDVLVGTAAMLAAPSAGLAQAEPPKPRQLVVNASGGSQIASLRQSYFNDFERETGIKIVDTSPTDFGKLRAMVESGNVVWNITEIGGQDGYSVTQMGRAEPSDTKLVD